MTRAVRDVQRKPLRPAGWANRWWDSKQPQEWRHHGHGAAGPQGPTQRIFQWSPNQAKLSHAVCGTCTYAAGHPVKRHTVISTKFQTAGGDRAGLAGGCGAHSGAQQVPALLLCACVCARVSYGAEFYNKTIKHSLEGSQEKFSAGTRQDNLCPFNHPVEALGWQRRSQNQAQMCGAAGPALSGCGSTAPQRHSSAAATGSTEVCCQR